MINFEKAFQEIKKAEEFLERKLTPEEFDDVIDHSKESSVDFLVDAGIINYYEANDYSMRCIGSLSRSWPERLAKLVNGVTPYLMRAKN